MSGQNSLEVVREKSVSLRIVYATGLDKEVHGIVSPTAPGKYLILLNASDSEEQQTESFLHECRHIFRGDLEKRNVSVNQIEAETHCGKGK